MRCTPFSYLPQAETIRPRQRKERPNDWVSFASSSVYFGESDSMSSTKRSENKPILVSANEVKETAQILKEMNQPLFAPGLQSAMGHAGRTGGAKLDIGSFTLGLVGVLEGAIHEMPQVVGHERMGISPSPDSFFIKGMAFQAVEGLVEKGKFSEESIENIKWEAVAQMMEKFVDQWDEEAFGHLESSEISEPLEDDSVPLSEKDYTHLFTSAPESEPDKRNEIPEEPTRQEYTIKDKLKSYFSFDNPFLKNPLTHFVFGWLLGGIITPFVFVTIPAALGVGFLLHDMKTESGSADAQADSHSESSLVDPNTYQFNEPFAQLLTTYTQKNKLESQNLSSYFELLCQCAENPEGVPEEVLDVAQRVKTFQDKLRKALNSGQLTHWTH